MKQLRYKKYDPPTVTLSTEGCKTIQNDTMSIREILVRFAGGQTVPSVVMTPQYPEQDVDFDDPLTEVDFDDPISVREYAEKVTDRCNKYRNRLLTLQKEYNGLLEQQQPQQQQQQQQEEEPGE